MDSLSSKRRKLSPTAAVAVNASNTPDQQVNRDARQSASYQSPTKSSLARFNPGLLVRPKSASEGAQRQDGELRKQSLGPDGLALSRGLNAVALRPSTPMTKEDKISVSARRALTASPSRDPQLRGTGISGTPRRRSQTPKGGLSPIRQGYFSPKKTLRRSPIQIAPASPPEEAREVIAPGTQLAQELQADTSQHSEQITPSKEPVGREPYTEDGEPELPPTPTQLGLEPEPEPPKGLPSSGTSRRASKRKGASMKSSPLKPRDPAPSNIKLDQQSKPGKELQEPRVEKQAIEEPVLEPEISKKQELLEQLSKQLKALQHDVTILEREAGNLQEDEPAGPLTQEEAEAILSILTSTNSTHAPSLRPAPPSVRLSSLLPFSRRTRAPKPTPPPESPLPSHHPIKLDNQLPHLRAFTPFLITSDSALLSSTNTAHLIRRMAITLSTTFNSLSLSLNLDVNTTYDTVSSLSLTGISSWADAELGTWIRNTAPTGDISSIGFASGRYWEIARLRAKCWSQCYADYADLLSDANFEASDNISDVNARKIRAKKPAHPRQSTPSATEDPTPSAPSASTHAEIQSHIGAPSLLFSRDGVSLLISWRITLDWTGNVESHIDACAAFPATWRAVDERRSLGKVRSLFERLLVDRGVEGAVRAVVAVVFSRL